MVKPAANMIAMVAVMAALPHARPDGLARAVGRPSPWTAQMAALIGAVVGLALTGWWVIPLGLIIGAAALGCGAIAKARIGGQTGDILGATQQIAEIAALLAFVALAT